jgi:hypothetical protein
LSRPSFQFYPGDWSKNANLRHCSPAARGVWVDILCLLHDSEAEYGVLRWPLKDVANAAGAPMPLVKELVAKGVLKGADKGAEAYVYRPKHAGKVGEPVILVAPLDGPVWFSSRFVRDEYVRQRRGESTRFDTANQPESRSPKGGIGERQGDGPSSSSSSSQETSEANASAADAAAGSVENSVKTAAELTKSELWRAGKSLLQQGGMPTAQCGTFVGKLVKDYGDELVIDAVRSAVVAQPADAATYLKATCMRLKGERKDAPPPATVLATGLKAEAATQQYLADHVMTPEEEARAAAARAEFLAKHKGLKAPEPEGQPQ